MDNLKNIVVGIDYTKSSDAALAQAMRMAQWNAAHIHVIHVIESLVVSDLARAYGAAEAHTEAEVRKAARRRANEAIAAAQALAAVNAETHSPRSEMNVDIVIGNPFYAIMCCIRVVSADLLILGAHGTSTSHRGAGTLAAKCVRKAPTKVMLVRENGRRPFARIAACIDFSESSALVIEQAIRCAQQDSAAIDVLHVFSPPWQVVHYMSPTLQASPDFQKQYRDHLNSRLEEFLRPYESETIALNVEHHLIEATEVKWGITEFLKSSGADLVVTGTRGRSWLVGMLIGTTAEAIVRDSPCSVLAIKPEGFSYRIG
ncbi:MAG TPA: universal stress protein [Phycisphaerae bacterium]|nr:universal stress protein [Pseudomonadales bacterium]HRX84185.1 universal stress protein [Phycisphaerae bacterium]